MMETLGSNIGKLAPVFYDTGFELRAVGNDIVVLTAAGLQRPLPDELRLRHELLDVEP